MASHAVVEFRRELDRLFKRRTHWLRSSVEGRRTGAPPKLGRQHVSRAIKSLQDLASSALASELARRDFDDGVLIRRSWHPKKGKGRGVDRKRARFNEWFDEHLGRGTYVYVFWNRRRCVYVGKSVKSGRRISSHFDKHWFGAVTRVDVYKARGRRVVPSLECLAIHRFQPARNKFRAERRKWTRRCGLCKVHKEIDDELRSIFRLR
jgi:hypothetical protein